MKRYTGITLVFVALFLISSLLSASASSANNIKRFNKGSAKELQLAKSKSYEYLASYVSSLGIDSAKDLKIRNVFVDELSMAHTKMQQTYNNVPVFGGETIVHLNSDGSLFTITNSLVANLNINTEPQFSDKEATNRAIDIYGCDSCLTAEPKVDMFVLRHKGKDHLVYRVQLERLDKSSKTAMPIYFIDAHTGDQVWHYDNLQTASAVGTGTSNYYGNVSFNTYQSGSTFYLEDQTRKIGVFDHNNGVGNSPPIATDTDNVWDTDHQKSIVDVAYGMSKTYDYFKNVHGRDGINGTGGPTTRTSIDGTTNLIAARVHYSNNYENASWNGKDMTFGDGRSPNTSSFTSIDICAHEFTHGVTQFTAGLAYSGESGGLNESFSDVFAALIERYALGESAATWKIGEEFWTPNNGDTDAIRYMDNPPADGESADYWDESTYDLDVHYSSGIGNKAFYLLAKGGTNHGQSMTGIGVDDAAKIWYKALTAYMTSSSEYGDARAATFNASNAIFGANSTQSQAVEKAWTLVGVSKPGIIIRQFIKDITKLNITTLVGTPTPITEVIRVRNTSLTGYLTWSASENASWLTLIDASGISNYQGTNMELSIDVTGLAAGTYTTNINFTSPYAENSPFALPVVLVVSNNGLAPEQTLQNQSLSSQNGQYRLTMQPDGNLVLYNSSNFALWASNTNGNSGSKVKMQQDGNLVIYNTANQAIWASVTDGNPGAFLKVQDDGKVAIYKSTTNPTPIWSTADLCSGRTLQSGRILRNANKYKLEMQLDGNLVLRNSSDQIKWASNTYGNPGSRVEMQTDGNLVIRTPNNQIIWASNTSSTSDPILKIQDDGKLVICRPNGTIIWTAAQ